MLIRLFWQRKTNKKVKGYARNYYTSKNGVVEEKSKRSTKVLDETWKNGNFGISFS